MARVVEHLNAAGQFAGRAGILIDDAVGALARLSEQHPESLVPAELKRAAAEATRSVGLIQGGHVLVGDIEARL